MAKISTGGSTRGTGFCGILFIVFLVLKLTENIAWSWWWVTAPLWMPTAIILATIVIIAALAIIFK